ncbi:TRAP transporter small permease subunit [Sneathiella limimaris]|uniref:TRAP transporter small permease subunit n=1 Tax=Sneathiella limimaris TaxID=1964213 RepID=UPI00146CD8DF|nr:TRAP transporter small permease [Sneathiella limimaris]
MKIEELTDLPLEKICRNLTLFMMGLCCLFLVLMMLHVGADVLLKLAFNSPIVGTLETVSYYYMVSLVFLALPFVEFKGEHVAVDLFFQKFPRRLKQIVYIFGTILAALYYGLFSYVTFLDALIATSQKETVMANFLFYVWPSRWALPIGSAVLVLMLLLAAIRAGVQSALPEDNHQVESTI